MGEFDGYYQWLGIPPDQHPPNHYRLLGLQDFESNAGVIDSAADRQSTHVHKYQTGPHSALSQRILNEIATARLCLLQPSTKEEYDRTLRPEIQPPPISRPSPRKPPSKNPSPASDELLPAVPMSAPPSQVVDPPITEYNDNHKFSDKNVQITKSHVVFNGKPYSIVNIKSVRVGKLDSDSTFSYVIASIVGIFSTLCFFGGIPESFAFGVIGFGIAGFFVVLAASEKQRYSVQLSLPSYEQDVLVSSDVGYVSRVVEAIKEAIDARE